MGLPERTPPPITRTMDVDDGLSTLKWTPTEAGGVALTINNVGVTLNAREFEWFLNDLRAIKPPGPTYRNAPPYPWGPTEAKDGPVTGG